MLMSIEMKAKTWTRRVRFGLVAAVLATSPWASTGCEHEAEETAEVRAERAAQPVERL